MSVIYNISKVVSRELEDYTHYVPLPLNDQPVTTHTHDVMNPKSSNHKEAYYLYFIAVVGIVLNCVVVLAIFFRRSMRKMTSGFLIHACFLDALKSAYCIPIASNLLSQTKPTDCNFFGATFVIMITIWVFNLVAMVCTEAYTFGEQNIGGNSSGTLFCIIFGVVLVYIGSIILHLGPTLIGGHFEFHPEIGSCSFLLGKQTGYVANVMWIIITSVALLAVSYFIYKLYKEIQQNQPNRVSFLVRTSITVLDSTTQATCNLRKMIKDALHRAKMFILNTVLFVCCWYPFFLLIIIDKSFTASPKIYQTFAFIAWSHGAIQPAFYILFDRHLNILARYIYCDKYRYDIDTIAQLMMNRQRNMERSEPNYANRDRRETRNPLQMNASPLQRNARDILEPHTRSEATVDIIREHQHVCLVPNSSIEDVENSDTLDSVENEEQMQLANEMARSSNLANESVDSATNETVDNNLNVRSVSSQYYIDNSFDDTDLR